MATVATPVSTSPFLRRLLSCRSIVVRFGTLCEMFHKTACNGVTAISDLMAIRRVGNQVMISTQRICADRPGQIREEPLVKAEPLLPIP